MPTTTINFTLPLRNRKQMRDDVIDLFKQEQPGTGKNSKASKYEYMVETLNAYSVVIKRPASLNKGFDFTVNIKGLFFENIVSYTTKKGKAVSYPLHYSNPKHNDIFSVLSYCKTNYANYNSTIMPIIRDIYNCKTPNLNTVENITFLDYLGNTHPIAIILLALKWLFIEQDFTYWNYSGRAMLLNEFRQDFLYNHIKICLLLFAI